VPRDRKPQCIGSSDAHARGHHVTDVSMSLPPPASQHPRPRGAERNSGRRRPPESRKQGPAASSSTVSVERFVGGDSLGDAPIAC